MDQPRSTVLIGPVALPRIVVEVLLLPIDRRNQLAAEQAWLQQRDPRQRVDLLRSFESADQVHVLELLQEMKRALQQQDAVDVGDEGLHAEAVEEDAF